MDALVSLSFYEEFPEEAGLAAAAWTRCVPAMLPALPNAGLTVAFRTIVAKPRVAAWRGLPPD